MLLKDAQKQIYNNKGRFYVYLLKRPNGIPFYVGKGISKGSGTRLSAHEFEARRHVGRNKYKINAIQKIWESGNQIDYDIVLFTDLEDLAFDKEIELISFYGRKTQGGTLTNLTDGGEGCSGIIVSEERRRFSSEKQKGVPRRKLTFEEIELIKKRNFGEGNPRFGVVLSEETKEKIRLKAIGRVISEATKIKMSQAAKGRFFSEETRRKISSSHIGIFPSKETRVKLSCSQKRRFANG